MLPAPLTRRALGRAPLVRQLRAERASLGEVVERLRAQLRVFRDEDGAALEKEGLALLALATDGASGPHAGACGTAE